MNKRYVPILFPTSSYSVPISPGLQPHDGSIKTGGVKKHWVIRLAIRIKKAGIRGIQDFIAAKLF
jgi:hypothetical protein